MTTQQVTQENIKNIFPFGLNFIKKSDKFF
jgi:hypothetical protein